jgi:hypothetical protein
MAQIRTVEPLYIEWFKDEETGNKISISVSNETKTVTSSRIVMDYIPDKFYKVTFSSGLTSEININEEIVDATQYKVDYGLGVIYIHSDREAEELTYDYYKRGIVYYPASRIYTGGNTNENLQEELDTFSNHISTDNQAHPSSKISYDDTGNIKVIGSDTQSALDSLENEIKNIIDGDANAEVGSARISQTKNLTFDDIDARFESLEQSIALNVKDYGVVGDGVTSIVSKMNILLAGISGGNVDIYWPKNGIYLLDGDITIPENVNLISNGATILLKGKITLSGDNTVESFTFDGELSSKGIVINGDNCLIKNNKFTNIKYPDVSFYTTAINVINVDNVKIINNIFDGIEPFRDLSANDTASVSRAIRVEDSSNILIEGNIFDNMTSVFDGDYVHIINLSPLVELDKYPFNISGVDGHYSETKGIRITKNTFYHSKCKSDIKIQTSGVIVENNEIVVDDVFDVDSFHSVIRSYNAINCKFINNIITVDNENIKNVFELSVCSNCIIKNNTFQANVETLSTIANRNYISLLISSNISVANNNFNLFSSGVLFYLNGLQDSIFKNNVIFFKDSTQNDIKLFTFKETIDGDNTDNIVVCDNIVSGESDSISVELNNSGQISNIKFLNNIVEDVLFNIDFTSAIRSNIY